MFNNLCNKLYYRNINYVYNIQSDDEPQTWMDPDVYLAAYMLILMLGIYLPTHFLFRWLMPEPRARPAISSSAPSTGSSSP